MVFPLDIHALVMPKSTHILSQVPAVRVSLVLHFLAFFNYDNYKNIIVLSHSAQVITFALLYYIHILSAYPWQNKRDVVEGCIPIYD